MKETLGIFAFSCLSLFLPVAFDCKRFCRGAVVA